MLGWRSRSICQRAVPIQRFSAILTLESCTGCRSHPACDTWHEEADNIPNHIDKCERLMDLSSPHHGRRESYKVGCCDRCWSIRYEFHGRRCPMCCQVSLTYCYLLWNYSGSITGAALKAEDNFDRIRIFERRETAGGTWSVIRFHGLALLGHEIDLIITRIFDPSPGPELPIQPGKVPPEIDPPLDIPNELPTITAPTQRERFSQTPVYNSLT